jgi:hypothetical protein
MKKLVLLAISAILTEKERTDSKVSRSYYTAEFQDPSNPFAPTVKRTIFQQHNADGTAASWRGGNPDIIKKFIGKEIPGEIVSKQVPEYDITIGSESRKASKYTTVVFAHETVEQVFKASGHDLNTSTAPTEEVVASAMSKADEEVAVA